MRAPVAKVLDVEEPSFADISIHTERTHALEDFLSFNDFQVDDLGEGVLRVARDTELPVYLTLAAATLYFELDVGELAKLETGDLYFELLSANTEIRPVSFAINNSNPNDPRLVLVESRETGDLSDQELLSVFDALELAAEKAESILGKYLK